MDAGICQQPVPPVACGVQATNPCGAVCSGAAGCTSQCVGNECITSCTAQDACKNKSIKCSAGQICKIECVANGACEGAAIDCGDAAECKVQCKGDHACKNATILCGTGPCSVSCEDHDHACGENTKLKCGPQACSVACSGFTGPLLDCAAKPCSGCPVACP